MESTVVNKFELKIFVDGLAFQKSFEVLSYILFSKNFMLTR